MPPGGLREREKCIKQILAEAGLKSVYAHICSSLTGEGLLPLLWLDGFPRLRYESDYPTQLFPPWHQRKDYPPVHYKCNQTEHFQTPLPGSSCPEMAGFVLWRLGT